MHMADGFISPAVGCTMWAASAAITTLCARKVRQEKEMRLVPLMGVLGAFIFACQMLNFTIPGTGSSGHLGGGLILAVLLGPYAGFLVMAAILTVQALFFADGGLLALLRQPSSSSSARHSRPCCARPTWKPEPSKKHLGPFWASLR